MDREKYYKKKIDDLFGNYNENALNLLINNLKKIDMQLTDIYNFNHPFFKENYNINFYKYLCYCNLNQQGLDLDESVKYMSNLYQNIPNWKNPGTMINIIPPVNVFSLACSTVGSMYNSNFAQDTYAGYLIASELEVAKYISQLVGWDWKTSGGVFTFGGKGTNLYATKIALNKCNKDCLQKGCYGNKYFIASSKVAHPCHYQVCDWLGIGYESCVEVDCNSDGRISLEKLEQAIRKNIEDGKKFLGVNLNGGNTNELVVDPIKEVYLMIEKIKKDYNLDYSPHIHVDSVIGWVYLFYNNYDFDKNILNIEGNVLDLIKKINEQVKEFKYADSLGIDFHKTGFCAYTSSLFMLKNRNDFSKISTKNIVPIEKLKYGDYNPYDFTLELSRSSSGAISALSSLKTLGIEGFQYILKTWMTSSNYFKNKIKSLSKVVLLDEKSQGLAVLFIILPPKYFGMNLQKIKTLSDIEIKEIRQYNVKFSKYLLQECLNNNISFYFTSSRSYVIPNTNISIGALKAYPTSVYFTKEAVDKIFLELEQSIDEYVNVSKSVQFDKINGVKDDMVYGGKKQ